MCHMQTDGIKIDKHFPKNLGQYFTDGFGSDGSAVKGYSKKPESVTRKDKIFINSSIAAHDSTTQDLAARIHKKNHF